MSEIIIGAGPAGLTAAYQLCKAGRQPLVLEQSHLVGGISRTEEYNGYRFDIGGHRFFTKVGEVEQLWLEVMGDDFIEVARLSRIYYEGKFYPYPIKLFPTLRNLGPVESLAILWSYASSRLGKSREERSLEDFVINKFGLRLYETFFKTYTEKVWGIPCHKIGVEWAAQRIKTLSLKRTVLNALFKSGNETSLIEWFRYPPLGPGMMWERFAEKVEGYGGKVRMNTEVEFVRHHDNRVTSLVCRTGHDEYDVEGTDFINSMPINHLIERLEPAPPQEVLTAARNLSYRDFVVVALVVKDDDIFPDNWIYVHSPEVRVGRIQNFKNWSKDLVPDQSMTCLGMEYFVSKGDDLWGQSREEWIALATRELAQMGLADPKFVKDGTVIWQPMAYPVYDETYKENLAVIRAYLSGFENLQTMGRAGMHRYNNQDHSMLTAMLAVKNILGEDHDLWDVNVERSYHEEFTVSEAASLESASLS